MCFFICVNFSLLYGFCGFDLLKDGWDRFDKSFTRYKVTYVKAKSGMIYRGSKNVENVSNNVYRQHDL